MVFGGPIAFSIFLVRGITKHAGLIIHDNNILLGEWLSAAWTVCFFRLFQHVKTAAVALDVATW